MLNPRPRIRAGRAIAATLLVAVLLPIVAVEVLARDATPPAELAAPLDEAKRIVAGQFDLMPLIHHVRYVDSEYRRSDHLVLLYFEIRSFPYLSSEEAYLVSRCVPLADFTAESFSGMGGGQGVTSRASDPELVYIRGPDQPPCP